MTSPRSFPSPHGPAQLPHTNTFAIISLIGAFVLPVVGVIFGHLALATIRRTGEEGAGLAKTGLAIGYTLIALIVVLVTVYFVVIFTVFMPIVLSDLSRR